jgi:hypothetical protein
MISWKVLGGLPFVEALQSKSDKFQLTQNEITFIVIDKLWESACILEILDIVTNLTGNKSIILPNFGGKLILCHDHWLHEVASSCVDFDVLTSGWQEDLRECPDALTPSGW